jgi:medium-chain acyl-[acyl-carrier-protein] hydrolase
MRAILFHHVGGDHYIFRDVRQWLLPEIESFTYELPGRADRIKEPLLKHMDAIVQDALIHTRGWMQEPFFFIGMSLGGLIAYSLALRLRDIGLPLPAFVFMASRKCPESYMNQSPASALPGDEFWNYVLRYGGCPPELPKNKELREFYEPILRADFAAAEDHISHFTRPAPLSIPTGIYYGEDDARNFVESDAFGWAPYFNNTFEYKKFPGDHFFLYKDPATIRHIKKLVAHGG